MHPLNIESVARQLAQAMAPALEHQILQPHAPGHGGVFSEQYGLPDPSHVGTAPLLMGAGLLYLARRQRPGLAPQAPDNVELLRRASLAIDFIQASLRPNGLVDLMNCNIASPPDTAFLLQMLCAILETGRRGPHADTAWDGLARRIEAVVHRAAPAIAEGGFHTPNHRWAIASALAQAQSLGAGDFRPAIARYQREGIDICDDGLFIERSAATYDTVNDRSLLLLAEHVGWRDAHAAAVRNLHFNLHLLHADATIETQLSSRQDFGTRVVPAGLVHCILQAHGQTPDPLLAAAAAHLWNHESHPSLTNAAWVLWALLKHGPLPPGETPLPADFSRCFPDAGLWRLRRGKLSASFFLHHVNLLKAIYGQASILALTIRQSYFGPAGDFIAQSLERDCDATILRYDGHRHPRRPGYENTLDQPVSWREWDALLEQRTVLRSPPAAMDLAVTETRDGLDLRLCSVDGMPQVLTQIAIDFPPGGVWMSESCALHPVADQVLFLRRGSGTMRYGSDAITLGPGADAHHTFAMRDATTAAGRVRVIIPLLTPLDHRLTLRFHHAFAH